MYKATFIQVIISKQQVMVLELVKVETKNRWVAYTDCVDINIIINAQRQTNKKRINYLLGPKEKKFLFSITSTNFDIFISIKDFHSRGFVNSIIPLAIHVLHVFF